MNERINDDDGPGAWVPEGKYVWDTWFAKDKTDKLHAFYLQADKEACRFDPERRHNIASVGHAFFDNGEWRQQGETPALAAEPDGWDNISIWTGSIIYDDLTDLFYMFYTSRNRREISINTPRGAFPPQQIGLASSPDLKNWSRLEKTRQGPVIQNPSPQFGLDGVNWRDPYVLKVDSNYHCLISARRSSSNSIADDAGGTIVLLSSNQLLEWNSPTVRIIAGSDDFYQMEVPQLFCKISKERKRYYLIFCAQAIDCSKKRRERVCQEDCQTGTYYICSDELAIEDTEIPMFSGEAKMLRRNLYAGKIVEYCGKTVLFGFDYQGGEASFKGGIAGPWMVSFSNDGTIEVSEESA